MKKFEGDMLTGRTTNLQNRTSKGKEDHYMFYVSDSQAFMIILLKGIVDFGCTHHMAIDASLFSSLTKARKGKYL